MTGTHAVIVIGGGHAGVEAAWAAANVLAGRGGGERCVALVTLDPSKIGVMSCNPAIGGLAKGQLVREVDALGGLMGLATDATGIQFKVLNTSKGAAVHGPRAQCDKHAYAEAVQRLIAARPEIDVIAGSVERLWVDSGAIRGVEIRTAGASPQLTRLEASAVVLTTGTFMRGLMHAGERKIAGGRYGEHAAVGISAALRELGFELGRLKTGTPPRLRRDSLRWEDLPPALGDERPEPFSDLSMSTSGVASAWRAAAPSLGSFPVLAQVDCRQTRTTQASHDLIRANLHRAPMYSGQIESAGPRYCPSIEDKVVRFADRSEHGVFLEPESLRDDWIYCNGISTSLPEDVQEAIVRAMPGCERAHIYRFGYAVEYDMVKPHQIEATGQTKRVTGLFLAGQINGTSGYEEAAAQGLVAGVNAARHALGLDHVVFGRDEAYIGVLMDDLVTRTPVEPYRMFTSRAEHRLMLRADNAADRLTPRAGALGLLTGELGELRRSTHALREAFLARVNLFIASAREGGRELAARFTGEGFEVEDLRRLTLAAHPADSSLASAPASWWTSVHASWRYRPYLERARAEIERQRELEHRRLPDGVDYSSFSALRAEAREALVRFRPSTFGQASRLEGITPADVTLLSVLVKRWREGGRASALA